MWTTDNSHSNALLKALPSSNEKVPGWSYIENNPVQVSIFEGDEVALPHEERQKAKRVQRLHEQLKYEKGEPLDGAPSEPKRYRTEGSSTPELTADDS